MLDQDACRSSTIPAETGRAALVLAAVSAFGTYFCMYAFRKPFTAAAFDDSDAAPFGVNLKTAFVLAQLLGYLLSKFIGIRLISEMRSERRAWAIMLLILAAEASLVGFAFLPPPLKILMMFLNGLPLGMVFGLVLGYLEGRRQTEALSAVLCGSFIASSGVMKSTGAWLLGVGMSPYVMPMVVGLLFLPLLGLSVWLLQTTPPPDLSDRVARCERRAMTKGERGAFVAAYLPGIVLLVAIYTALTVVRTIRDDFGVEIWRDMGVSDTPSIFAISELAVALVAIIGNAGVIYIANNLTALRITLIAMAILSAAVGVAGLSFGAGALSPLAFMIVGGVGLYFPYVAFHTTVFERLIAVGRRPCNLGFLMYVADAIGYLGYAATITWRSFRGPPSEVLPFYLDTLAVFAVASVIMLVMTTFYFERRRRRDLALEAVDSTGRR